MSREKYQRYEARYNRSTAPVATNNNRLWTPAEEARLLETWCQTTTSPDARIHVAKVLGRTYIACFKRHAHCHRKLGNWSDCKADRRRRDR